MSQTRVTQIAIRLTKREKSMVARAAKRSNETPSSFCRRTILETAEAKLARDAVATEAA